MKISKLVCARACVWMALLGATTAHAQSTNLPALTIRLTNSLGTNFLALAVTNHLAGDLYELYYAYEISTPLRIWTGPYVIGQTNQTNFLILEPEAPIVFLQARNGIDQDGDGVPNYQDSDPFDPTKGILQVFIFNPPHGSTIQ